MTIGEKIREARKKAGMSQQELADKLEIKSAGISQWEKDKRTPKLQTMLRIADAIGISITELLALSPENEETIRKDVETLSHYNKELDDLQNNGASSEEIAGTTALIQGIEEGLNSFILPAKLEHQRDLAGNRVKAMQSATNWENSPLFAASENRDATSEQKKVQEMIQSFLCQTVHSPEDGEALGQLISAYKRLNVKGRMELIKRAEEMTYVPDYDK